jgi:hypothetical protein
MSAWFRPRRYGYGATPTTWQGWLATVTFLVVVFGSRQLLESLLSPTEAEQAWAAVTLLVVVGFAVLARSMTHGVWRWRWGGHTGE